MDPERPDTGDPRPEQGTLFSSLVEPGHGPGEDAGSAADRSSLDASETTLRQVSFWRCLRAAFWTVPEITPELAMLWAAVVKACAWRRSGIPEYILTYVESPDRRSRSLPRTNPWAWPHEPAGDDAP